MNLQEKMQYVADEVKKVEKWAEDNRDSSWYDDYVSRIKGKLAPILQFAKDNTIPFVADANEIADKHYDDTDGYSEDESSSSYYEDESSDYDKPEEDDSVYDNEDSDN